MAESRTKPKLLIVDDDDEIRTQMKWALAQDYTILLAGDRTTALELFRTARPSFCSTWVCPLAPGRRKKGWRPCPNCSQ